MSDTHNEDHKKEDSHGAGHGEAHADAPHAEVADEAKKHGDAAKHAAETTHADHKTGHTEEAHKPDAGHNTDPAHHAVGKPSFTPTRTNHEKVVANTSAVHANPAVEKKPAASATENAKGGGLANKAADLFEDSVKYTAQGIGYLGGGIVKGTGWVLKKSYNGVAAMVGGGYSITKRFFRGIGKGFKNAWHGLEKLTWANLTGGKSHGGSHAESHDDHNTPAAHH